MTFAIYVRQSEDKTGHAAAVARQEHDCGLLAQAKGWTTPQVFADNSVSATNGRTRPEFERLLSEVEAGRITAVAVWHLDRLTRSMRDLNRVIDAGKRYGLNIASVHGVSLDLGDPTGVAVAQILTAIAAMETAHKGERQRRANAQRAEQGQAFWTRRPFGYDRKDGAVFVVPAEAEAIRDGARAVLEGATVASVARDWNLRGLKTSFVRRDPDTKAVTQDGGQWGITQVRRVLTNPRYAGRRLYNGADMGSGDWEPILDADTLAALEQKLTDPRRRTAPADLSARYLLSGIAICGKCGSKMYASPMRAKGQDHMIYRCFGGYCLSRRLDLVDEVVSAAVIGILSRPDAAQVLHPSQDLLELQRTAHDLRQRRDALAAMLAEGLLSAAAVREQSGRLTTQLQAAEDRLALVDAASPVSALLAAPDVRNAWEALGAPGRRAVVRFLMDVTIMPAGKGIRFRAEHVSMEPKARAA